MIDIKNVINDDIFMSYNFDFMLIYLNCFMRGCCCLKLIRFFIVLVRGLFVDWDFILLCLLFMGFVMEN
jgi:hypothetical protein